MLKKIVGSSLLMLIVAGCGIEYRDDPRCEKYNYMSFEEFRNSVRVEKPREIEEAGKIYLYGDTLLVNEKGKGIHIIDNSDKHNPINKAYIKVIGNRDIAVKDGYMMVDSLMDLVVMDINDMDNIREVNRTENIFPIASPHPYYGSCEFDLTKGLVIGEGNEYIY